MLQGRNLKITLVNADFFVRLIKGLIPMATQKRPCSLCASQSGYVLLLMLLLIVVLGALIWLDPSALFSSKGPNLPWNENFRMVKEGQLVPSPSDCQPQITQPLLYTAKTYNNGAESGEVKLSVSPEGLIKGGWGGEFNPDPNTNFLVMGASFNGNIDPTKIYEGTDGRDPTKVYLIAKGKFIILETNLNNNRVRSVKGKVYVTGWMDTDRNATGDVIITSDRRSFRRYTWTAKPKIMPSMFMQGNWGQQ